MSAMSPDNVRVFLTNYLIHKLKAHGLDLSNDLPNDCDLLLSGYIDSLGLLELLTAIQEYFGREIDFEALDPEQMTVVGPLCKFVAEQMVESTP